MRGSFERRMSVAEQIADGDMTERVSVPLFAIMPHAKCPKCKEQLKPNDPSLLLTVNVEGKTSPKARDRLGALDILAKYGLGPVNGVSADYVVERLEKQYRILLDKLEPDVFEDVSGLLADVWR